jgi:hypothetical protein
MLLSDASVHDLLSFLAAVKVNVSKFSVSFITCSGIPFSLLMNRKREINTVFRLITKHARSWDHGGLNKKGTVLWGLWLEGHIVEASCSLDSLLVGNKTFNWLLFRGLILIFRTNAVSTAEVSSESLNRLTKETLTMRSERQVVFFLVLRSVCSSFAPQFRFRVFQYFMPPSCVVFLHGYKDLYTWTGCVECMRATTNARRILVENLIEGRWLIRAWNDNIKMELRKQAVRAELSELSQVRIGGILLQRWWNFWLLNRMTAMDCQ